MQSGNANQPPADLSSQIQEKVKEADLYLSQGLFEQARLIYQELLEYLTTVPGVPTDNYETHRLLIQEQLAIIDKQEMEFHGGAPPAPEPEKLELVQENEGAVFFNRALALLDTSLFAEALEDFKQAAALGYQPAECAIHIANAHKQLGQHLEAVAVLEEALQLPNMEGAVRNRILEQLGSLHEATDEKGKALEVYQQLATVEPNHPTALSKIKNLEGDVQRYHLNLARLHLRNQQFPKVVQQLVLLQSRFQAPLEKLMPVYQEILQKDPGNIEALRNLAGMALSQGELALAVQHLERIQELHPMEPWSAEQLTSISGRVLEGEIVTPETHLILAGHLLRTGRFDSAVSEYLEVIVEDSPCKLAALNQLGEALLKRRDYDRILELLADALPWVESLKQGPETLTYYSLLGNACEKKFLYDQAQAYFQRAAAIDPKHEAIQHKVAARTQGPLASQGKALLGLQVDAGRQYQILETAGQDEIHQFYRVAEVPTGTVISIAKTLLPDIASKGEVIEFIRRWVYEQTVMENRNIVRVFDVAEGQGQYYVIMEDFQSTLEDVLADKECLPLAAAVRLARALLNGLAYAHSHRGTDDTLRKIFHLALHPRRILVSADLSSVKIADFGMAYLLDTIMQWHPEFKKRSASELAYMAPEQFNRSPSRMPDRMRQATDIYAFGVIFYQVLTGHLPFSGPTPEDFRKQHGEKYAVPPRVFISTIPAKLDEAILKCLHKDPKKRWRTPTELDLDLEKINLNP